MEENTALRRISEQQTVGKICPSDAVMSPLAGQLRPEAMAIENRSESRKILQRALPMKIENEIVTMSAAE